MALFFKPDELVSYERVTDRWIVSRRESPPARPE
jgi:hypothetical protein